MSLFLGVLFWFFFDLLMMLWWAAIYGVIQSRTRLSDFPFTFQFAALEKVMATHSSVLAWRIQGWGSLVGCCLWGHTELDTTDMT